MSAGTNTVGGVMSRTMTLKELEPVLPCESVAVQVTGVVPRPKVLPDAGEQFGTRLPSTVSLAEAENVTTAPLGPVAAAVMSAGTLTFGAVVSWTVMSKATEVGVSGVFGSVAVHVTVVVPKANTEPGRRSQLTLKAPVWLAVTLHVAAAPAEDVASTV
jgi:hypothetical protein